MSIAAFADPGLESYLQKADEKDLGSARYWHILLHMPDGQTSEIDDADFFIAEGGQSDARSELHATIKALYDEKVLDDNSTACKYPARKVWLQQELGLEELPQVECKTFDTLMRRVDPQSVTLVFPFAHVNSPASMFGHTFLRIDSSYDSKMLSYAINYAANADTSTENGAMFAIKGLFGGYYGKYSLLPYYEKLKEYRDTEQRDIWEYDLDLTPDEVRQMMRHIWEIRDTYSWYYFFDENCSYNMLWLIEVARPSIHLREYFTYQVIPPETVHAAEAEGIVQKHHYRPSKYTVLLAYEKILSSKATEQTLALTKGLSDPKMLIPDKQYEQQEKRYILEAASELTEYDYIEGKTDKEEYLQRFHSILSARSQLGKGEEIAIDKPENPDQGHRAVKSTFSLGWRDGRPIQFAGIRPAYHHLEDSDIGFLRGTQIEFLDILASYSDKTFQIEEATILSIVSITPRSDFFQPLSWRMKTGWDRDYMNEDAAFTFTVGAGLSWGSDFGYLYLMADPLFYLESGLVAALGGSVGAVLYEGKAFKSNLEATRRFYATGEQQWILNASQHWRTSQNSALTLSYDHVEKYVDEWDTLKVTLDYFF